jgi:hypothetical protein
MNNLNLMNRFQALLSISTHCAPTPRAQQHGQSLASSGVGTVTLVGPPGAHNMPPGSMPGGAAGMPGGMPGGGTGGGGGAPGHGGGNSAGSKATAGPYTLQLYLSC